MNLNIVSLILIVIKFNNLIYASNANVQANQSITKGTTFDDDESGEELILTENELDHQRINKQMNQSSNSSCDHGWYSFEDQCYYFHEDMSGGTFYESLNICRHYHNSNLITITSKAQNDFLKNLLFNKLKLEYSIWLGLIRLNSTNFLWLNNANKQLFPVVKNNNQTWSSFTNWAPNEPNNFNSKHYCVVMSSEQSESLQGHWYDVTCNEAYLVICQRPSADSQNQSSIINNDSDIIKNFLYDHEEQITRRDEMKKLINLLEINIILWILLFVMILLWFCYHRFYRYYHHHDRSSFGHNQRFLMSRKHHKFHDNNGNLLQNQQPNDDTDNTDDELCSTSFIWNNNLM